MVDHAAAAQSAGLSRPATQVIIFGNPKAGTPIMRAAPEAAIDLGLDGDQLRPLSTPQTLVDAALAQA